MNNRPRANLRKPTVAFVNNCWKRYRRDDSLRAGSSAVKKAFSTFPNNRSASHIRLKACVLNDVYSTNMVDTGAVARHITGLKVDRRLVRWDPTLVDDIADVPSSGGARRAYSFASKYCSLHQPNGFAIYDSFVDRMLWEYQRQDEFSSFRRRDLKHYPSFMDIIQDFRSFYGLERVSLRHLDKFLWYYGREVL